MEATRADAEKLLAELKAAGQGNRVLTEPQAADMRFWLHELLVETKNALDAHMTLYGTNPAGYDRDSSWGALQTIVDSLAAQYWKKLQPVPSPLRPNNVQYAVKLVEDYVKVSTQMPLVDSGWATNHSKEKYAKLLLAYLNTLLALHQNMLPPAKVYNRWTTNTFL